MSHTRDIARIKQWIEDHHKIHELEHRALDVASEEMTRRLNDHNNILPRIDECVRKDWFERIHDELMKRVDALEKDRREESGRRVPIAELARWVATVTGALFVAWIAWSVGHFMK
jgi:hypothetical protein